MPTYAFRNKETDEEFTDFMTISQLDEFLEANPHLEQLVHGAPLVGYRGMPKPNDGFRDILREIKKKHVGSNINTF